MREDCKEIQHQIAGYVDHEIDPRQADTISRHLEACSGCAEEANAQQRVKEIVHERAKDVAAPPHLRAQVRRCLNCFPSFSGFWAQFRYLLQLRPLPTIAMAMTMVLFASFATYFGARAALNRASLDTVMVEGHLEGEIVCIDCILLQLARAQFVHDATHRLGMRCQDGHLWAIIPSEKSRGLSEQVSTSHRHVQITGQLFPRLHYIQVKDFSLK